MRYDLTHHRLVPNSPATRMDCFRQLRSDYRLTVETLRIMELRDLPEDAKRITEYRQFASELSAEWSAMFREANDRALQSFLEMHCPSE